MKNKTLKNITSQRLFLPIFCLALVLLVNIITTPNFFSIEIRDGVLYGYMIDIINRASDNFEPSIVAKFAISLAQAFNKYYAHTRILDESPERDSRLALCYATATVLKEALRLLGVEAPDEM